MNKLKDEDICLFDEESYISKDSLDSTNNVLEILNRNGIKVE
jgi:hypothetical protein